MPRSIFHIHHHPNGPRVWLCSQRVHHGAVGVIGAAVVCSSGRARPTLAVAALLIAHDAHDWRKWFVREGLPTGTVTS
jgi:hypothetical protein